MEDKFIKEFENFCDIQLLKDYGNKIRTEIINGLEDLQKRNDNFSLKIIHEEINKSKRVWGVLRFLLLQHFADFCLEVLHKELVRREHLNSMFI